jgi:16S rRNA G966 N2-methylase RsmD
MTWFFLTRRLPERSGRKPPGSWKSGRHLQEQALIYVESPRLEVPVLPVNWALHRELLAGEVRAALYRRMSLVG